MQLCLSDLGVVRLQNIYEQGLIVSQCVWVDKRSCQGEELVIQLVTIISPCLEAYQFKELMFFIYFEVLHQIMLPLDTKWQQALIC